MSKECILDQNTKLSIAQALWMKEYDEDRIPKEYLHKIQSPENSNGSFARRFNRLLTDLEKQHLSFLPSWRRHFKIMEGERPDPSVLSPQEQYGSTLLAGPLGGLGYDSPQRNLDNFVAEHDVPHFQYQREWHAFVGNFTDRRGDWFSVQLIFTRYSLLPPGLAAFYGLSEIENQVAALHLAVSDQKKNAHYRGNTFAVAGTTGLVSFSPDPYEYRLGYNRIASLDGKNCLFPAELHACAFNMSRDLRIEVRLGLSNEGGIFNEKVDTCEANLDSLKSRCLTASNLQLLQGVPNEIRINDQVIPLTGGHMWYDHQWGSAYLSQATHEEGVMRAFLNTRPLPEEGGDWFMMQFHRGVFEGEEGEMQISLSAPHSVSNKKFCYQRGAHLSGTMSTRFEGKILSDGKTTRVLRGRMLVTSWVKSCDTPNEELYPATNIWYPAGFEFIFDENISVPGRIRHIKVSPIVRCAQTGYGANGRQYSAGGTIVSDVDGIEIGRGFCKSTHYAHSYIGILKIAGLPVNSLTISLFTVPKPSLLLRIWSLLYVLFHPRKIRKLLQNES